MTGSRPETYCGWHIVPLTLFATSVDADGWKPLRQNIGKVEARQERSDPLVTEVAVYEE
jgi:hypothetical protein